MGYFVREIKNWEPKEGENYPTAIHYLVNEWDSIMPKNWNMINPWSGYSGIPKNDIKNGLIKKDINSGYGIDQFLEGCRSIDWAFNKNSRHIGRIKSKPKNLSNEEIRSFEKMDFDQSYDLEMILHVHPDNYKLFEMKRFSYDEDLFKLGSHLLEERISQFLPKNFSLSIELFFPFGEDIFSKLGYTFRIKGLPISKEEINKIGN